MGANGQAVFTTSSIGPGVHGITASYSGDTTFLPSTSSQILVTIDDLLINRVRQQQHHHPARHHGALYPAGFAGGCERVPVHGELCGQWSACGGKCHILSCNPSARRQNNQYHYDGHDLRDCLEHATAISIRAPAPCPGASASPLRSESSAKAVAADSPIPGSGAAGSAQPDSGRGTKRVFGCWAFRGAESSLLHHRYSHRRNTSALNQGAPCDRVIEVRRAAWEKVCIDLWPCYLWERCWDFNAPGLHGQVVPGGRDFSLPRAEVSLRYSPPPSQLPAGPMRVAFS